MSIKKIPNQKNPVKVSNSDLLPGVFRTDPNKKMTGATLDVATSKGQLVPFNQTFGLRISSESETSFFVKETDPAREESQTNIAFVTSDDQSNYTGKTGFLDIDNYFKLKNLPLKTSTLDNGTFMLDLPLSTLQLTEYSQYYWISDDLPVIIIEINADEDGTDNLISSRVVGKPSAVLVDSVTGKTLELQTGMRLILLGTGVDEIYRTTNVENPKIFYVKGAGAYITLVNVANFDQRVPLTSDFSIPEYLVMDRFVDSNTHWSVINKWYHINLIRSVADFLDMTIDSIASASMQAQRPIIQFYGNLEIHNWISASVENINGYFQVTRNSVNGSYKPIDYFNYQVKAGDKVVFVDEPGIWEVVESDIGIVTVVLWKNIAAGQGVTITSPGQGYHYKLVFTGTGFNLAQNKTSRNQAPLFTFYDLNGVDISTLPGSRFEGGRILDFAPGAVYDTVLDRYVSLNNVDFEIVSAENPITVSGNQIEFITDADITTTYIENNNTVEKKSPFAYALGQVKHNFWKHRFGLQLTQDIQDILYDNNFSEEIKPMASDFTELHLFADSANELKIYYKLPNIGYVRFTVKNSAFPRELFLPLVSGKVNKIICHNLPSTLTFYKSALSSGSQVSDLVELTDENGQCLNNGIANGTITIDLSETYADAANDLYGDIVQVTWKYNNIYRFAIARDLYKWRFLQSVYLQDKTYPIYDGYEFNTIQNDDAIILEATTELTKRATPGDNVIVESVLSNPTKKTAPISLTKNPLNEDVGKLNYYSLYQHFISVYSNSLYGKEYADITQYKKAKIGPIRAGSGTFNKHSNPLAKTAVMVTQFPFDFADLLNKQAKHYDGFYNRLKTELEKVVSTTKLSDFSTVNDVFTLALDRIYVGETSVNNFWAHSNMMGWGVVDNYVDTEIVVTADTKEYFVEPINHSAGKETIVHIINTETKRFLTESDDYFIGSDLDGYNTYVQFSDYLVGKTVIIRQWLETFNSRIPASLAKIGLAPVYKPEIYHDTSYSTDKYFLYRHDGSRYYLVDGVDSDDYPLNRVDALLFEYEKAVWSSIAHDIKSADFSEYYVNLPGGFRTGKYAWNDARGVVIEDAVKWFINNSIFFYQNNYDGNDGFTFRYSLVTESATVEGSWRAIYRYFYDTDRLHTHPWEMLKYSVKPSWWDDHYSWTDTTKRQLLEQALRTGNRLEPGTDYAPNPQLARINNVDNPEEFPVDSNGNLISPNNMTWLTELSGFSYDLKNWEIGDFSDYDLAFLSTHIGVASETKLLFLSNPTTYVVNNWIPGQTFVTDQGLKLNKVTNYWIRPDIDTTNYHRVVVNGLTQYTAGIESLYSEFCVLNNISFYDNIVQKLNNIQLKKEFLLQGFTNKNNVRIKSTSITGLSKTLFVPEENYQVRTVKHYPHKEIHYSGMRILWDGDSWFVFGFNNEYPFFDYYKPTANSKIMAVTVENIVMKQKISYDITTVNKLKYGTSFSDRQELYDFILGYGVYLESIGFVYQEPEGNDLRNWQLSAKQFVAWSNDVLDSGNFIDLNPSADELILNNNGYGQFDNLAGTNNSSGLIVDRTFRPLFTKDLLVIRDNVIRIKTKDSSRSIYGMKMTFSNFESVVHLDNNSIFDDVYFSAANGTTKRSFLVGGKKSDNWTGEYFIPGYMFTADGIIPNFDSLSEVGRNLLNVENTINDTTISSAVKAQFGLSRNSELRELFLTDDIETQFKNSIAFEKGTTSVFSSLQPLTQTDTSNITVPNEDYLVKIGEIGNTENIEYYEFELSNSDIKFNSQLVSFTSPVVKDKNISYVSKDKWVYRPYKNNQYKPLAFDVIDNVADTKPYVSPLSTGDTDYTIQNIEDIKNLYKEFSALYNISNYSNLKSYSKFDQVRYKGTLYYFVTTASSYPNLTLEEAWALVSDKAIAISESYLPNILVENYVDNNEGYNVFQTFDVNLAIEECCAGPTDVSLARITTADPHNLQIGDIVLIINAESENSSVNGIWTVKQLEDPVYVSDGVTASVAFYIETRIIEPIYSGKVFHIKSVKYNSEAEFLDSIAGTTPWKSKFNPLNNILSTDKIIPPPTPSGFPSVPPIAIIDNDGGYSVYAVRWTNGTNIPVLLKQEQKPVKIDDIEQLLIYNYETGNTEARVEIFDPKKFAIPGNLLNEIDSVSRVDPARYNRTTDNFKSVYESTAWRDEKVGERWWNTSTLRLVDYDTGSVTFKLKNWGKTVGNSLPDVYEWTKSPVPPSQWINLVEKNKDAFGTPASGQAYIDSSLGESNYSWTEEKDNVSGKTYNVYYFWVKNKNVISQKLGKKNIYSTEILSKILLNPTAANIPWWAPVSTGTIILSGVKSYLNDQGSVVQIKKKLDGNEKSHQWLLFSENDKTSDVSDWMHTRLRDSLSLFSHSELLRFVSDYDENTDYVTAEVVRLSDGSYWAAKQDISAGTAWAESKWLPVIYYSDVRKNLISVYKSKPVPDVKNLHKYNLLGNQIRPFAQSWFADPLEARRTLIKKANALLKTTDLVYSTNSWDRTIGQTSYLLGNRLLDITVSWDYEDYTSDSYDADKAVRYVVQDHLSMFQLELNVGDYVKIETLNLTYEKLSDGGFGVVYRTNGTIKFNEELFSRNNPNSWDSSLWDSIPWDVDVDAILSSIVDALRYDIFVNQDEYKYKNLMAAMLRYVLSEQTTVDWLTKASTIKPTNLIGQALTRSPDLERDKIATLVDFYSSVKPYRDKIRDANLTKENIEDVNTSIADDHDMTITMNYNRVQFNENVITGLDFYPVGWDDAAWDMSPVDTGQDGYDYQLQQTISAGDHENVLQGASSYPRGENEAVFINPFGPLNVRLLIDVDHYFESTHPTNAGEKAYSIRMYQYKNVVEFFVLDNTLTSLTSEITNNTKTIALTNVDHLPDASVDNIQYVWINKEKIGYTIKTSSGISGLIRAAHGTTQTSHPVTDSVYVESAKTMIIKPTNLSNLRLKGPFLNDLGSMLHYSSNANASILNNYTSS